MTLTSAGLTHLPVPKLFFGILALLINMGIGLATIVAYMRWMKALDEMLRQIWIESMALTFGVLWVALGGLIILEKAEINDIDSVEIGLLTMLAALGMILATIRILRYK